MTIPLLAVATSLLSCSSDTVEENDYLPPAISTPSSLDAWIEAQWTLPYNMSVVYTQPFYREEKLHPNQPPQLAKVRPTLTALQRLWVEPAVQAMGKTAFQATAPREIRLFALPNINALGKGEVATNVGETTVPIYNVNDFSANNEDRVYELARMAFYCWAKRLVQQKGTQLDSFAQLNVISYSAVTTDVETGGAGPYAFRPGVYPLKRGFFTTGAMTRVSDDFAETLSIVTTSTPATIRTYIETAREFGGDVAANTLQRKVEWVDNFLLSQWGIKRQSKLARSVTAAMSFLTTHSETTNPSHTTP